jgi:AraC-like DNA-binding protein
MNADAIVLRDVVLERLSALGVDVAGALERAGIPLSRFTSGSAVVPTAEYFAFWRAAEASGPPDVGLRLGSEPIPGLPDIGTIAALDSVSAGEALEKIARYKRLCMPERLQLEVEDGEASIAFHWLHALDDSPKVLVDSTFAYVLSVIARGTRTGVHPLRLELARRRSNREAIERFFGCPTAFDATHDRLVFSAATLELRFVSRRADLRALFPPSSFESALENAIDADRFTEDVRNELGRIMVGGRPSVEKLAAALRMSPRTLQRRLGEERTSYQHLLDDERQRTARRLQSDTDLEAGQIAFVLGFEELNSFSRAFHTWAGSTPTRWRVDRRRMLEPQYTGDVSDARVVAFRDHLR